VHNGILAAFLTAKYGSLFTTSHKILISVLWVGFTINTSGQKYGSCFRTVERDFETESNFWGALNRVRRK